MEKKVGIYCYLVADILTQSLQTCFCNSPLSDIFPNSLIGLDVMAIERHNLQNILKNQ